MRQQSGWCMNNRILSKAVSLAYVCGVEWHTSRQGEWHTCRQAGVVQRLRLANDLAADTVLFNDDTVSDSIAQKHVPRIMILLTRRLIVHSLTAETDSINLGGLSEFFDQSTCQSIYTKIDRRLTALRNEGTVLSVQQLIGRVA